MGVAEGGAGGLGGGYSAGISEIVAVRRRSPPASIHRSTDYPQPSGLVPQHTCPIAAHRHTTPRRGPSESMGGGGGGGARGTAARGAPRKGEAPLRGRRCPPRARSGRAASFTAISKAARFPFIPVPETDGRPADACAFQRPEIFF